MKFGKISIKGKFLTGLIVCLTIFGIIILIVSLDFNHQHLSRIRSTKKINIPVTSFRVTPTSSSLVGSPVDTSGCGDNNTLSLLPGQSTYLKIKSGNSQRRILVYLPPHYNNMIPHEVVLGFHGYDASPLEFEKAVGFDSLANANNFIAVYPEGSQALGGARGWNTGLHPTIRADDILFVSTLLNSLQANLCINKNRIYATGFSNGGGFVAELACKLSGRIAAFAPVSGSYLEIFNTCTPQRPVPIIEFHGTADKTVPYLGLPSLSEVAAYNWVGGWAKRDGCQDKPVEKSLSRKVTSFVWQGCGGNAAVIHYKIFGEGHQWPSVFFTGGLNTSQTIWNFFQQHPLNNS